MRTESVKPGPLVTPLVLKKKTAGSKRPSSTRRESANANIPFSPLHVAVKSDYYIFFTYVAAYGPVRNVPRPDTRWLVTAALANPTTVLKYISIHSVYFFRHNKNKIR